MRILYVAGAVEALGTSGGSVHISEVACGLQALGHRVLVVSMHQHGYDPAHRLDCDIPVVETRWRKELALLGMPKVARALYRFKPDAVIERFYNFAGAGVLAAHRRGVPSLLEVNAPMIDPPSSLKSAVDRRLLGLMRRWAVQQGHWADAIVTPLNTTVPPEISRAKIHELPWGANVEQFNPERRAMSPTKRAALLAELGLAPDMPVAVFVGSFRRWHGVEHFAEVARRLIEAGTRVAFLAVGGGPELEPLKLKAAGWNLPRGRLVFAGPQPHERVPDLLALADVGVAPFSIASYAPLQTFGFYWSPLKVFEYMAMSLPVVTISVPPLNTIVRDKQEGLLYPSGDVDALTSAIKVLVDSPHLARQLGEAGRERVVAYYSWQAHCAALDAILGQISRA